MNKDLIILIGVIITNVVLLVELVYVFVRRGTSNKLIQAAFEKNENRFNSTANSLLGKSLSEFDKELIKFNVAEIRRNNNDLEKSIQAFSKMKLSNNQKKKIYPRIFYYYIDHNKKEEAKACYEILKDVGPYKNKKDVEMTYDTYINESHKYLDEALNKLKHTSKENLPTLEKTISKMYENKKINAEAKKYARLAERHQIELEKSKRK